MNPTSFDPVKSYGTVHFYCPRCVQDYDVKPPFNLIEFCCPGCAIVAYPIVYVDNVLVDLRMMREILSAIHGAPGQDQQVMRHYAGSSETVRIHEPLVDGRLLAFHSACVAYCRASVENPPFWVLLFLIFPPTFLLVDMAFRWYSKRGMRNLYPIYLGSWLSLSSFDPRFRPPPYSTDGAPSWTGMIDAAMRKADVGPWGEQKSVTVSARGIGSTYGELAQKFSITVDARAIDLSSEDSCGKLIQGIVGGISPTGGPQNERQIVSGVRRVDDSYVCSRQIEVIRTLTVPAQNEELCKELSDQSANGFTAGVGQSRMFTWYDGCTGDGVTCLLEVFQYSGRIVFDCSVFRRYAYSRGTVVLPNGEDGVRIHFVPEGEALDIQIQGVREWRRFFLVLIVYAIFTLSCISGFSAVTKGGGLLIVLAACFMFTFSILWRSMFWFPTKLTWLPEQYHDEPERGFWERVFGGRDEKVVRDELKEKYRLKHAIVCDSIYNKFFPAHITDYRIRQMGAFSDACVRVVQDSIIRCCEDAGLDMSEYRRQLMQIHNHGVIVNQVKGNVVTPEVGGDVNVSRMSAVGRAIGSASQRVSDATKSVFSGVSGGRNG